MGFFSRKESATAKSNRPSSDDQLIELRNRARRRLIGAVVLVLAAIVLLPVFLSDQSTTEPEQLVSVIPSIIPPSEEQYRLSESLEQPLFSNNAIDNTEDPGLIESTEPTPPVVLEPLAPAVAPEPVKPVVKPEPKPKPESKPKPEPVKPAPKPATRTDDGSVALALLEGRTPPKQAAPAAQAQQGSFIVQAGAYSSQNDANARRGKLVSAGVSNAYVESAVVSGGKSAYRLRVGPFPSRQAAQAAQARLRSLGYENSFISTK